jgi:hypothetical protein
MLAQLLDSLARKAPRRVLLAALSGGLLTLGAGILDLNEAAAKKHAADRRRKRRRRDARRKKRKSRQQADPITRVDATCTGAREGFIADVDGDARLAQTFTALASGPLVRAEIPISKDAGSDGDYILRLSPLDGAGVPTNDVLAEAAVADDTLPLGESTLTFTFTSPAPVVAGVTYALVLTRPGIGVVAWVGENIDNPCAGRAFFSPDQTTPFTDDVAPGTDLFFTTFVTS